MPFTELLLPLVESAHDPSDDLLDSLFSCLGSVSPNHCERLVDIDMELEDATHLMFEKQVKKLPIVTQGKLVSLITLTDVARFQPQMIRMLKKLTTLSTTNMAIPKRLIKVMNYYVV